MESRAATLTTDAAGALLALLLMSCGAGGDAPVEEIGGECDWADSLACGQGGIVSCESNEGGVAPSGEEPRGRAPARVWTLKHECPGETACVVTEGREDWHCLAEGGHCTKESAFDTPRYCAGLDRLECGTWDTFDRVDTCAGKCVQYAPSEWGGDGVGAFCVSASGAGDTCHKEALDKERCVGTQVHACRNDGWAPVWEHTTTCKKDEACKAYPHERVYCVQPNGLGDYCDRPHAPKEPNERCVGNAIQRCDPDGDEWRALEPCKDKYTCAEAEVTADKDGDGKEEAVGQRAACVPPAHPDD